MIQIGQKDREERGVVGRSPLSVSVAYLERAGGEGGKRVGKGMDTTKRPPALDASRVSDTARVILKFLLSHTSLCSSTCACSEIWHTPFFFASR